MIDFKKSYEDYYEQKQGKKWNGHILEIYYLQDLKACFENLFNIEREINPEFKEGNLKYFETRRATN